MSSPIRHIATLLLLLLPSAAAYGQIMFGGEVGTDLNIQAIENNLSDAQRRYDVDRRLSRQFIGLRYSGPLATRDFAELAIRLRFAGTYSKVNSVDDGIGASDDEYISPELDQISASIGLFPLRTYPLRYTLGRITSISNRYEPGRRQESQAISPGLAVIRRYDSRTLSHSLQWQAALPRQMTFSTELRRDENRIGRRYDLSEDRDIWVIFTTSTPDPAPTHFVDVVNTLDDRVVLFIDLAFVDTLSAGESVSLELPKGTHEVDLIPTRFNRFNATVDVQSAMQWRIVYTPPKGSSDLDQKGESIEAILRTSDTSRLRSETRLLLSDTKESVQGMTSGLTSLNNQARYNVRQGLDLNLITSYNGSSSDVSDISSQTVSSFLHQTEGRWMQRSGASASLSHAINHMESEASGVPLNSNTNTFNGRGLVPTRLPGHTLDMRASATLLADNKGYSNDQYLAGFANKFEYQVGRFKLKPQHEMRFTHSAIENAGLASTSDEAQSRLALDSERPRMSWLNSDVRLKAEWEWRSRDTDVEHEVKNRYFAELGIVMRPSNKLMIRGAASQENEGYDTDAGVQGRDRTVSLSVRPDRERRMYRLDLQGQPTQGLSLGAGTLLIEQDDSQIERLSLNLSGRLPWANLPVRSFLLREVKSLEGLDDQSLLQMQVQTSYRFRQISIVVSYALFKETLIVEDYSYSEFYVKISRAFEFL